MTVELKVFHPNKTSSISLVERYFSNEYPEYRFHLGIQNNQDSAIITGKSPAVLTIAPPHLTTKEKVEWYDWIGIPNEEPLKNDLDLPDVVHMRYIGSSIFTNLVEYCSSFENPADYLEGLHVVDSVLHTYNQHWRLLVFGKQIENVELEGFYEKILEKKRNQQMTWEWKNYQPMIYHAERIVPFMILDDSSWNGFLSKGTVEIVGILAALGNDGLWRGHELFRANNITKRIMSHNQHEISISQESIAHITKTMAILESLINNRHHVSPSYKIDSDTFRMQELLSGGPFKMKVRLRNKGFDLTKEPDPIQDTITKNWIQQVMDDIPKLSVTGSRLNPSF